LDDGGASAFAQTVRRLRAAAPNVTIEVLIPDLSGRSDALNIVLEAGPDVLNHNLETVPRLYAALRPAASYQRSLRILESSRTLKPEIVTKTGIMVGLGETFDEIRVLVKDLASVGTSVLTIGQYLQPTPDHFPIARFVTPGEFVRMERTAVSNGILNVVAGPLVRSSYKAGELLAKMKRNQ
jgi:lipoyl synthase